MNTKLHTKQGQQGQILLVVVLLLATTLTIVMTVVFTSRTETKVSKLQQDSDRSLVAAEAGIEAAIKNQQAGTTLNFSNPTLALSGLSNSGIDMTNSSVKVDSATKSVFVSPVIQKDQQYTVYLTSYDGGVFGASQVSGSISLYYDSDPAASCDSMALELTFVSPSLSIINPGYILQRSVADTGNILNGTAIGASQLAHTITEDGIDYNFNCVKSLAVPANAILLFARVIGDSATTRIGIDDSKFPAQGKTFYSEARTTSGVTKKVKVFQSYPQIPADLFITSLTATNIVN